MAKKSSKTVKVYSAEWCPWCRKTKEWLKERKIKFQEIDIEKNPKAAEELVEKSGQTGIPVIEIDGQIIVGFNPDALRKALKIKE